MTSQVEQSVDRFAHSRACVRQAVYDITTQRRLGNSQYFADPTKPRTVHVGPTYVEIRIWIEKNKDFIMENVGARCRQLFEFGELRKEEGSDRRVHVYPVKYPSNPNGKDH